MRDDPTRPGGNETGTARQRRLIEVHIFFLRLLGGAVVPCVAYYDGWSGEASS